MNIFSIQRILQIIGNYVNSTNLSNINEDTKRFFNETRNQLSHYKDDKAIHSREGLENNLVSLLTNISQTLKNNRYDSSIVISLESILNNIRSSIQSGSESTDVLRNPGISYSRARISLYKKRLKELGSIKSKLAREFTFLELTNLLWDDLEKLKNKTLVKKEFKEDLSELVLEQDLWLEDSLSHMGEHENSLRGKLFNLSRLVKEKCERLQKLGADDIIRFREEYSKALAYKNKDCKSFEFLKGKDNDDLYINFLSGKTRDIKTIETFINMRRQSSNRGFLLSNKSEKNSVTRRQIVFLLLSRFILQHFSHVTVESVEQGFYIPSFESRGIKIDGECTTITRSLSHAIFFEDKNQFLNNMATSISLYERIVQGKQVSEREREEVFALSKLLERFKKQLSSPIRSLPLTFSHTGSYKMFDGLSRYISNNVMGNFAIHLVTNNHVVAIYRVGDNYAYFDTNVAFVSGMRDVQELIQVVEKGIKLAGYEVEEKGLLVEHFDVVKANSHLSSEDKQILAREIKTERQLLAEQDKEFGLIKVNDQEISRVQLYDFGAKINVKGSVPFLINADMNLSSKNFSEYLSAGKVSMTAREYLDSLKGIKNVEEAVQATKFIPFIGSKSEIEKAEQIRKQKGSLLEVVKETINFILSTISLASTIHLGGQLAANKRPDSYLGEVKVDNQLEKSLSF